MAKIEKRGNIPNSSQKKPEKTLQEKLKEKTIHEILAEEAVEKVLDDLTKKLLKKKPDRRGWGGIWF